MNQTEAMKMVRLLLLGMQRARSTSSEWMERNFPDVSPEMIQAVKGDLLPWLEDENGKALVEALAKVDARGSVTGMEFYNFMVVIHILNPAVAAMAGILSETTFPEPSTSMIMSIGI